MKLETKKDGTLNIIAETGADEFFLQQFLPYNGGISIGDTFREYCNGKLRLSISIKSDDNRPNAGPDYRQRGE